MEKGSHTAAEFGHPEVQAQAKRPLKDAAAVNATRWELFRRLEALDLPLEVGVGSRTKFNRVSQGYCKAHWIDAACVGLTGAQVLLGGQQDVLHVRATGRGSRQMCTMNKYGFPRTGPKMRQKDVHGFRTGDMVRAVVPARKKAAGTHMGRVAVRKSGIFHVGRVDGINWRECWLLQRADGYGYSQQVSGPIL
jgi:hypothetical protein